MYTIQTKAENTMAHWQTTKQHLNWEKNIIPETKFTRSKHKRLKERLYENLIRRYKAGTIVQCKRLFEATTLRPTDVERNEMMLLVNLFHQLRDKSIKFHSSRPFLMYHLPVRCLRKRFTLKTCLPLLYCLIITSVLFSLLRFDLNRQQYTKYVHECACHLYALYNRWKYIKTGTK